MHPLPNQQMVPIHQIHLLHEAGIERSSSPASTQVLVRMYKKLFHPTRTPRR